MSMLCGGDYFVYAPNSNQTVRLNTPNLRDKQFTMSQKAIDLLDAVKKVKGQQASEDDVKLVNSYDKFVIFACMSILKGKETRKFEKVKESSQHRKLIEMVEKAVKSKNQQVEDSDSDNDAPEMADS